MWGAGIIGDFHQFDTRMLVWADLSGAEGRAPPGRSHFGMASVGSIVYVFGGWSVVGEDIEPLSSLELSVHLTPTNPPTQPHKGWRWANVGTAALATW